MTVWEWWTKTHSQWTQSRENLLSAYTHKKDSDYFLLVLPRQYGLSASKMKQDIQFLYEVDSLSVQLIVQNFFGLASGSVHQVCIDFREKKLVHYLACNFV